MAMVHILQHDESIYNVEKKEAVELKKMPIYHSKFEKQVRLERSSVKEDHRTMGFNAVPLKKTDQFLRKGSGVRYSVEKKIHICPCKKKDSIPKQATEIPQKSDKNFKIENIKRVVSAAPKKFTPRFTDTRHGVLHDLKRSGLMPVYIYQPKFGKLPSYLIKRMREMQIMQEQLKDVETQEKPLCRYITQEERAELLGGLKHNWEEQQKEYQILPVLTDTIPKMMRKTKMETNLKQLEKDILLIENHPYIYIYNDEKHFNK